jgi:hypothetical protein
MAEFALEKALQAIAERNTPEVRAEMEERSREFIGRLKPNSPAARAKRNRQIESIVLRQIATLNNEPASQLRTVRLDNALNRLGEIRAELGDYRTAIGVTVDEKRRETYVRIQEAINRDDDEKCDCPADQVRQDGKILTLEPRVKIQTIMTEKGPLDLYRCAKCGHMNAK